MHDDQCLMNRSTCFVLRIVGRVVCFNYTGPREDMQAHDCWIMENSLIPHMQENKVSLENIKLFHLPQIFTSWKVHAV